MLSDPNVSRRFFDKILVGDDCWEWTSTTNWNGYGRFRLNGRAAYAHRVAYEMFVGPIPIGLQLDHLCRNRGCVRPDHLEPVTSRENSLRGETIAARNANVTHCPRGHAYDEDNTSIRSGRRFCRTCDRVRNPGRMKRRRIARRDAAKAENPSLLAQETM